MSTNALAGLGAAGKLVTKEGEKDDTFLAGKVVGVYFSAHWCGPCRRFTPMLRSLYSKLEEAGKPFEIVFCSSDKGQAEFDEYYGEMPWTALPFGDERINKLKSKFKVRGIPTFAIVDETGELITVDGRGAVMADPEGEKFPWKPPTFEEILSSGPALIKDGAEVDVASLKGKHIGLYFSAHWCPPCKMFTPVLVKWYEKTVKTDGKNLEIVFVSSDHSQDQFDEYFETMPWASIPFNDSRAAELSRRFEVQGIPTLVFVDENGDTVTTSGRGHVDADPEGADFPYLPKPLNAIGDNSIDQLNDAPALVVFKNSASDEAFEPVFEELQKESEVNFAKDKNAELSFLFAKDESHPLVARVRQFTKTTDLATSSDVLAIILDIQSQGFFKHDGAVTGESLKKFIADFRAGTLARVPLTR